ncbi:TIGR04255 family protein [Rhizobium laguerreae]|nr:MULTISPECIES: TIGR04255 family protein [Rhizobium]MBY3080687.1 TIGR04255 family protein [Rhizobium laguerreae]MBY3240595.1 TIGR04255 family protein [Rhizobium laguerreae]MBY3302080.1 TIGR04255 family protein [Rhizobium laguerreae]MDU0310358.1 TIGR04255 family protein [Rhizobium sp. 10PS4]NKM83378.1 TIGR04255 family protein [Rhizobium laguerreae]
MRFRPLNEDHAIESVKFSVAFSAGILGPSIMAVEQGHSLWRDSLPARSIADVSVESNGRSGSAPGVLFSFLRPDGLPSWSMAVAVNRIDIECSLYSRWERVWAEARGYFVKVIEILSKSQPGLEIGAVELTVKDVFLATERDYPLNQLLKPSVRLPKFIFEAGQAWHANSGWFEVEANGMQRTLHNLNCDATPDDELTVINISHYQQGGMTSPVNISANRAQLPETLEQRMSTLHKANKQLMVDILKDDMANRIGLGAANNVDI